MSGHRTPESYFTEFCGQVDLSKSSYDDLCDLIRKWVEFAEGWCNQFVEQVDLTTDGLDQLARVFQNRHVSTFRTKISPKSLLEVAFFELFLLARIRSHVLAYLSVQECEDFEGSNFIPTRASLFISQFLQSVGIKSCIALRPGFGRFRFSINLDPLTHLRGMYAIHLKAARQRQSLSLREKLCLCLAAN